MITILDLLVGCTALLTLGVPSTLCSETRASPSSPSPNQQPQWETRRAIFGSGDDFMAAKRPEPSRKALYQKFINK